MASYEMCEICYDDKLVITCGAGGVCDKKVCMKCKSKTRTFNCLFCFQHDPRLEIIFELEDRFNWAPGQGPPGIDAYIHRYNVWSYGCVEIPECECNYCRVIPEEEIWQKIFEHEMSNP